MQIKNAKLEIKILRKTYQDQSLILIKLVSKNLVQIKKYGDQKDKTLDEEIKKNMFGSKFDLDQIGNLFRSTIM